MEIVKKKSISFVPFYMILYQLGLFVTNLSLFDFCLCLLFWSLVPLLNGNTVVFYNLYSNLMMRAVNPVHDLLFFHLVWINNITYLTGLMTKILFAHSI